MAPPSNSKPKNRQERRLSLQKPKPKLNSRERKQSRIPEKQELALLREWITSNKPAPGTNPLVLDPLPRDAVIGRVGDGDGEFSRYAGVKLFEQLPVSRRTRDGLSKGGFKVMSDIQRASLPFSLSGRDILGAAKTGSGKTLAFIIPVLEALYKAEWIPEFGVGSIIITPTWELGSQIFEVLNTVGKFHCFSAGLLIGGHDVDVEKDRVNHLNILVCTPGRLLQHMDETQNFDCSQLQVLVLDEADRLLDRKFKKDLDPIINQLPKERQTLLFSATQTKSVQDLARLSLKNPEYISVHEKSDKATPSLLQQSAIEVPLDQKLDMLWSFIKSHLNSKILVFLSTCKQVKFVFEAFKKLRPGIPLKCLHGRFNQQRRMAVYADFCQEQRSVLFATDVASRGLDFDKTVDWVVQVDCPDDVDTYIHRAGRTARYHSEGKSLLFLMPSEAEVFKKKLESRNVPLQCIKANPKKQESISKLLAAILVKYPDMQLLAGRAFVTYLKSIYKKKDKEVFVAEGLPCDEFAASLGLSTAPRTRFLNQKSEAKTVHGKAVTQGESGLLVDLKHPSRQVDEVDGSDTEDEEESTILLPKESEVDGRGVDVTVGTAISETRTLQKKKRLKINIHRPAGTRVVFDDDCNEKPPLAEGAKSDLDSVNTKLDSSKVQERYAKHREEIKHRDKIDKNEHKLRLKEQKLQKKIKRKKAMQQDVGVEDDELNDRTTKKARKYSPNDEDNVQERNNTSVYAGDSTSLAEQEDLALKLLNNMHS